jgi:hypothetical protein
MLNKHLSALPLSILISFLIFLPSHGQAGDISKKVVATHGDWEVVLNYQNVANPTCQISANALSPEMKYAGLVTIWRDYKADKKFTENINIEVGVVDIQGEKLVRLNKGAAHQFGNDNGVLNGITRDQDGMLLFMVTKDNFRKLINPSSSIFMAITQDASGKEIALGTSLEGIEEACVKCGFFD